MTLEVLTQMTLLTLTLEVFTQMTFTDPYTDDLY